MVTMEYADNTSRHAPAVWPISTRTSTLKWGHFLVKNIFVQPIFNAIIPYLGPFWSSVTPPGPPSPNFWVLAQPRPSQKNGPDMEFLENLDFEKHGLGVESEAETFTNGLSVPS